MASRKEQKEALRAERERKAREAEAAERRRRMIGFGAAGVLVAAAVVAIVVVLVTSGGSGDGDGDMRGAEPSAGEFQTVSIPAQETTELDAAAKAADCKVTQHESEGRDHTGEQVEYKTNPPTSGPHSEFAAQDGAYTEDPGVGQLVHALEHGRVVLWYRPDASARLKGQLKSLYDEDTYHVILAPNPLDMPAQVAASSWTRSITCERVGDKTWDALRAFRDRYRDQAPEQVP
jgi:hypothetical protein